MARDGNKKRSMPHPLRRIKFAANRVIWQPFWNRLSREQQKSMRLIGRIGQLLLIVFVGILILYGVVNGFLGAGIFAPRDGPAVAEAIETPSSQIVVTETVRVKKLYGNDVEQDTYRSIDYDFQRKRYQGTVQGIIKQPLEYRAQDATVQVRIGRGAFAQLKTPIPYAAAMPPTGKTLGRMNPKMVSDTSTVNNQRAWLLTFDPDAQFLRQCLWTVPLKLSGPDQRAILANKFQAKYGRAWVSYNDRQLLMMDTQFTVNSARYRCLFTFSNINNAPLD